MESVSPVNKEVKPIRYSLRIEPDPGRPVFPGCARIELETREETGVVTLNALDLEIRDCAVRRGDLWEPCSFCLDARAEQLHIRLPEKRKGTFVVKIDYEGRIQEGMVGFYRSRYNDGRGGQGTLLVTQFEESDARRAFPCMDRPDAKARFQVEMVVDEGLTAISNGPIIEEISLGGGKKRVLFQETPRMSTYLLFFGLGDFEFLEDREGEILVRAVGTPGVTRYAGPGLEFGKKSLRFCEDYYGVPYPLPKLDLIAVSDFAFGAMENWGAITFRENLLLFYPGVTSRAGAQRIYEIIAHEIVHQWFGNLVTPSDWKYLWLNESFATYFGFGVAHHYFPEMGVWQSFLLTERHGAQERDALHRTFAIEIPGGEHVVINEVTAPIIYSKGANILRQIEGYVGSGAFRLGLQRYLKKFACDCASSHHLWEALEEASEKPVTRLMKSWLEQPGYPVLEVRRQEDRLVVRQRRFTFLENESTQWWLVPVTVTTFLADGSVRTVSTLLEGSQTQIDLDSDTVAYMVNPGATGFYRVRYLEPKDLLALGRWMEPGGHPPEDRGCRKTPSERPARNGQMQGARDPEERGVLPVLRSDEGFVQHRRWPFIDGVDRWGLQDDLYAMVRAGHAGLDDYLELLSVYSGEEAYLPVAGIAGNLFHAYLVLKGDRREKIARMLRAFLERVLSTIGTEPDPAEQHNISALRDQILFQAAQCGSEGTAAFLLRKFEGLRGGGAVHQDITRAVMQAGAAFGNREALAWLQDRFRRTESEHDRMNVLVALACFCDRGLTEEALGFVLESVPGRNTFVPLVRLAANPHAHSFLWEWFVDHLERLESLPPTHFERIIAAIVPLAGLDRENVVRAFFDEYMGRKALARDTILMALEMLEINRRMRAA